MTVKRTACGVFCFGSLLICDTRRICRSASSCEFVDSNIWKIHYVVEWYVVEWNEPLSPKNKPSDVACVAEFDATELASPTAVAVDVFLVGVPIGSNGVVRESLLCKKMTLSLCWGGLGDD